MSLALAPEVFAGKKKTISKKKTPVRSSKEKGKNKIKSSNVDQDQRIDRKRSRSQERPFAVQTTQSLPVIPNSGNLTHKVDDSDLNADDSIHISLNFSDNSDSNSNDSADSDEINIDGEECKVEVQTLEEFIKKLGRPSKTFSQGLADLRSILTWVDGGSGEGTSRHQSWITVDKPNQETLWLDFRIFEDKFSSQIAEHAEMQRVFKLPNGKTQYRIQLLEHHSEEKRILLMEIGLDSSGALGELIHVGKGEHFSGNEILGFFNAIRSFLNIPFVLLDSAKYPLVIESSGEDSVNNSQTASMEISQKSLKKCRRFKEETRIVPLLQRYYLPIVSDEAQTWYETKAGFTPFDVQTLQLQDGGDPISQNTEQYRSSVRRLREKTLGELATLFQEPTQGRQQQLLLRLSQTYFPDLADRSHVTLHTLSAKIYQAMRLAGSAQIRKDFHDLCFEILSPQYLVKGQDVSEALLAFDTDRRVLESLHVWVRY
jgi:hypothetical protein